MERRDRFYFYVNCSKDDLFHERERERKRARYYFIKIYMYMYIGEEMNFIFSTKYTYIYIYIYTWKEEIGFISMLIVPRKIYFAREREREREREDDVVSIRTIYASCRDVLAFIEMVSSRAHCKY